ncbi:MAG: ABC transporter substrate-binding protein [Oscillospiraceae bacterium]|nr:ABC transporter substrate-binding protein [Oscillospiraceae bacterium]
MGIKKLLSLFCVLAVFVGVLSGCSSSTSSESKTKRSSANETLTFAQSSDISLLDPHLTKTGYDTNVTASVFETLLKFDENGKVCSSLAKSWNVSSNGLLYNFEIREGVTFHDGEKLDAAVVKKNVDRMLVGVNSSSSKYPYASSIFGSVEEVKIVGDFRVEFVMKQIDADFLTKLAMHSGFAIISPKALDAHANDEKGVTSNPIGTGPFVFRKHTKDQSVELERNDKYWGKKAEVMFLNFKIIKDPVTRVSSLCNGEIDIASEVTLESKQKVESSGCNFVMSPALMASWLIFNVENGSIFANKEVRIAAARSMNVKGAVESLYKDSANVASGFLPEGIGGFSKDLKPFEFDPESSKKKFEELGIKKIALSCYTSSKPYNPVGADLGSSIAGDLRAAGVEVELINREWLAHAGALNEKKFEAAFYGWMADYPTASNFFPMFESGSAMNKIGYSSEEFERLFSKAKTELDEEKRNKIYEEMNRLLTKTDVVCVPISNGKYINATRANVKGFVRPPFGGMNFSKVSKV